MANLAFDLANFAIEAAAYVVGAVALWLLSYVFHPFAFFRTPERILSGRWHRYGVGFHEGVNGKRPIHDARLRIVVLPLIAFAISKNNSYSYFGIIRFSNNNMYIGWTGLGHSERMFGVFCKPLTVNQGTYIIGTKSCIDRDGQPAMNKEIISKSEMHHEKIRSLIGGQYDSQFISNSSFSPADYEL